MGAAALATLVLLAAACSKEKKADSPVEAKASASASAGVDGDTDADAGSDSTADDGDKDDAKTDDGDKGAKNPTLRVEARTVDGTKYISPGETVDLPQGGTVMFVVDNPDIRLQVDDLDLKGIAPMTVRQGAWGVQLKLDLSKIDPSVLKLLEKGQKLPVVVGLPGGKVFEFKVGLAKL